MKKDIEIANAVITYDDVVDGLFDEVKTDLIEKFGNPDLSFLSISVDNSGTFAAIFVLPSESAFAAIAMAFSQRAPISISSL